MSGSRSWIVLSVVAAAAAPAWSQSPIPCTAQLSPAQQARFRMLEQACQPSAPLSTWQRLWRAGGAADQADALVATDTATLPRQAWTAPVREAAHLQMYGGSGLVMARMGPPRVAATRMHPVGGSQKGSHEGSHKGRTKARAESQGVTRAVALAPEMDAVARRHDIDPLLLHAVAHVESRHNAGAVSHAGARGLMQVMPATAARFGVKHAPALHDAPTNLEVSAAYLKTLQGRFGTNLPLVLAAYNAGEGAVERYGRRIPPFAETQSYVRQVLATYAQLTQAARQRPAAPVALQPLAQP